MLKSNKLIVGRAEFSDCTYSKSTCDANNLIGIVHPFSLEEAASRAVVEPPTTFCLGAQGLISDNVELSAQGDDDLVDFSI